MKCRICGRSSPSLPLTRTVGASWPALAQLKLELGQERREGSQDASTSEVAIPHEPTGAL